MTKVKLMVALMPLLAMSSMAQAGDAPEQRWQVRARALAVLPDTNSTISAIGGKANAGNSYTPEVDISYFFTPNIAAELIAATTKHSVSAHGTSLGDVDLGNVWLLPPTLTLQYHFQPGEKFQPYVGAGLNYTVFYNADHGAANDISYQNSWGTALQAGFDYKLEGNWYANMDVKKLFLNTTAKINGGSVRADVDIDPWIIGAGVGYRF